MTPLDRTLALAEGEIVAVCVREDLNLDVTRTFDELLDINRVVAKCVLCFPLRGAQRRFELRTFTHHAHSLSAAAGSGLEQHGITKAFGE